MSLFEVWLDHQATHPLECSSSSTYDYIALLLGEIRLMTLLPGSGTEPIHCEISSVALPNGSELDSIPSYEALSYMWSTYHFGEGFIYIGDAQLFARGNLMRALRRLRYEDKPRVLWVDAVCINQSSIPERNEQVSRMQYIYRQASTVLVWVGDERIGHIKHSSLWLTANLAKITDLSPSLETDCIIRFCCAAYWKRLWIIQELLVARKVVVHLGPVYCGWNTLAKSLTTFADRQVFNSGIPSLWNTPIWTLVKARGAKESRGVEEALTLRQLLLRHGDSECQDKRDRIYGLVGVASDCQNGAIPIDYSVSMEELFDRVVALYPPIQGPGTKAESAMARFVYHLGSFLL